VQNGTLTAEAVTASGLVTAQDGLVVDNDGATVATFDRATSDGTIVDLQKDGSSVGSVASRAGDDFIIGVNNTGLNFRSDTAQIRPRKLDNTSIDNTVDLGNGSDRFKDLYLSGGVYLGGTGSANKLEDYEEGTFTVTTNGDATGAISIEEGGYVKIGNFVIARVAFSVSTNFTSSSIGGLPFASGGTAGPSSVGAVVAVQTSNTNGSPIIAHGSIGDTNIAFSTGTGLTAHSPNTTNNTYRLMVTYITN